MEFEPMTSLPKRRLQHALEFFGWHVDFFQYPQQGRALYWIVPRDNCYDPALFVVHGDVFALPHDHETGFAKRSYNPLVRKVWEFVHRVTTTLRTTDPFPF
jgi:hypothetical protein